MRAKMSEKTQYEAACDHTNILEPNSLSCYAVLYYLVISNFFHLSFFQTIMLK